MRRYLMLVLVLPAVLLAACSSSDDASSTSSTAAAPTTTVPRTVASVAVTPENTAVCADITAYEAARKKVPAISGDLTDQSATALKTYLTGLEPYVTKIKANAPVELTDWATTVETQMVVVKDLDPTKAEDRQKLGVLVIAPTPEQVDANAKLVAWAETNCGVAVG